MQQHAPDAVATAGIPNVAVSVRRREVASSATGWAAQVETTKPGITRLVTMTALAGYVLTVLGTPGPWGRQVLVGLACGLGTALSAAGANAINQWMERERDGRMERTRTRPIPSGRVEPVSVLGFGTVLCAAGLGVLWIGCGLLPMLVSLACIASYLAVYTPLKPLTPLATFVGAIPGALPPMIGSSAASAMAGWDALREPAGLALFTLMMVWQIPHFLAIAWLYREDYAKGGYAVLPVLDPHGTATAWTIALWTCALLPATVLPAMLMGDLLGSPFVLVAGASGLVFCVLAARLLAERSRQRARALFLGSVMHLPLLLCAMIVESAARTWL